YPKGYSGNLLRLPVTLPGVGAPQEICRGRGIDGRSEEEALPVTAAQLPYERQLGRRLDPFGNDLYTEVVRHVNDSTDHLQPTGMIHDTSRKGAIELEGADRQAVQFAQG